MVTEEKERRRLNKNHPGYAEFRDKVDAAVVNQVQITPSAYSPK